MTWFKDLFGFEEISFNDTKSKFVTNGDKILSIVNKKSYNHGFFHKPCYNTLPTVEPNNKSSKVTQIVANIKDLYKDKNNEGSIFQVASQFNCLEMAYPSLTKYHGVTLYENDHTQGPLSAMCCAGALIYRNYFLSDIDNLEKLDYNLWRMQNGYCIPYEHKTKDLRQLTTNDYHNIKIGIQENVQVTIDDSEHLVTQAFCSSIPLNYINHDEYVVQFSRRVLLSQYETLFKYAVGKNHNKLFLTMLGGGAFGNNENDIVFAIEHAINKYYNYGLDIVIVNYRKENNLITKLVENYE